MSQFVEYITHAEIFMYCSFYSKILSKVTGPKVTIASVIYVIATPKIGLNLSNDIVDMQTINISPMSIMLDAPTPPSGFPRYLMYYIR